MFVGNAIMWCGPIICIVGGYCSIMNDLTQQLEWVKLLWCFLLLVISGLVGFGIISRLEWVYIKDLKTKLKSS